MSTSENKAIVRHVIEEGWRSNFDALREHPALHETIPFLKEANAAAEFSSQEIMEQVAEGDWVVTRALQVGTHVKDFMGIPTGTRVKVELIMMHRIEDGVIVEQHSQGGRIA